MIHGPHATPLRLIHAHRAQPPEAARPPRVLCEGTVRRLAALNDALRALRAMGVRVLEHSVRGAFPADDEPLIRIERNPAESIAALLDAAGPRSYWTRGTGADAVTVASCTLLECRVMWEERP